MSDAGDKMKELAGGKGVLINCDFGYGIRVDEMPDGRASITVDPMPLSPDFDGIGIRDFMETIAVEWLKAVAPHRLAR